MQFNIIYSSSYISLYMFTYNIVNLNNYLSGNYYKLIGTLLAIF